MSNKFSDIVDEVCTENPIFRHYLSGCSMAIIRNTLYLEFPEPYTKALVGKSENRKLIAAAAKKVIGRDIKVIIPDYEDRDWDDSCAGLLYDEGKRVLQKGMDVGRKMAAIISEEIEACSTWAERKVIITAIGVVVEEIKKDCLKKPQEGVSDDREPDF